MVIVSVAVLLNDIVGATIKAVPSTTAAPVVLALTTKLPTVLKVNWPTSLPPNDCLSYFVWFASDAATVELAVKVLLPVGP